MLCASGGSDGGFAMFKHAARLSLVAVAGVCGSGAQEPTPQIPRADAVRIGEAFRLAEELQEQVWKGWSQAPFALLFVTSDHEFLIRHPRPSQDFLPVAADPRLGPVSLRKRKLSEKLLAAFPAVGGVSTIVVGSVEATGTKTSTSWVVTVLHEHFHQWGDSQPNAFEDALALGLARGDQTGMWMLNYPFPYSDERTGEALSEACRAMRAALEARGTAQFEGRLAAYRKARDRFKDILAADDYKYFSFQLWKEGVARYTEQRIARLAAERFKPSTAFAALPDFEPFERAALSIEEGILGDLARPLPEMKRTLFYAVGAGEAMLLDAAAPGWKDRYLKEKFFLERYYER
jgi:hypothetical protein